VLEVDPEIAALVSTIPIGTLDAEVLEAMREGMGALPVELSDKVERKDYVVPGDPDVVIRVHRPVGVSGLLPCFYAIHGGGYVLGSYAMDDARFDAWCPEFGCVGVSVEYRLAPETPYPGPLDDCYLGLKWVYDHHDEIGVDPGHIGIGGVSAGGGLAASTSGTATPTPTVGVPTSAISTARRTYRHTPPRRGPRTSPDSHRRTSVWAESTDFATRTSSTPPASTRPGWRRTCTCTPAPPMG
jgi:acetyl esterase/lipase